MSCSRDCNLHSRKESCEPLRLSFREVVSQNKSLNISFFFFFGKIICKIIAKKGFFCKIPEVILPVYVGDVCLQHT